MSTKTHTKEFVNRLIAQRDYLQLQVDRLNTLLDRLPVNGSGRTVLPGDELWIAPLHGSPFKVVVTDDIVVKYQDGDVSRDSAKRYFSTPEEAAQDRINDD